MKTDSTLHRTGLTTELVSHEAFHDGDKDESPLTVFERRRYSALILNQVAVDYDKQLRIGQVQVVNGRAEMSLGWMTMVSPPGWWMRRLMLPGSVL